MDDAILRGLAYTVLLFVVAVIAIPIKRWLRIKNLKKYPTAQELSQIRVAIRGYLKEGQPYKTIIENLRSRFSYPKYMMEGFIIDVENEEPALLDKPKSVTKSGFTFECPRNWKIKPLAHDLDADKYFTVEGSASGIMSFCIYDEALDDLPSLAELNEVIGSEYQNYQIKESISNWGHFMGTGNRFEAKVLNNELKGQIFLYQTKDKGFYLSQAVMNDDAHNVLKGFKMVEESFKGIND